MKFKKMIFVLSITTFVIFLGMFGTSYAYYVSSGGTNVSASTPDFDPNVAVVFNQSEYINIKSGVPILSSDVNSYASKSTFTLIPDANILNNSQVAVYIKLVDVNIDDELKVNDFKYKLVCNDGTTNRTLSNSTGANITSNTIELGTLSTSNSTFDVSKNYNCTFSVWLQENGDDQNDLMNKKFSGKLKVETMFKGGKAPVNHAKETLTRLGLSIDTSHTPDFSTCSGNSCTYSGDNTTGHGDGTNGIYKARDDLGTSYYFRGAVNNNYVSFAGKTWRIVRINGDGTVRIALNGSAGTSAFNEDYDDNAYVGYMYGTPGSSTYALTHANTNNSTIKTFLDEWYDTNLSSYSSYIADSIFCNDRSITPQTLMSGTGNETVFNGKGIGTSETAYSALTRNSINFTPSLICPQNNDKFTVSNTLGNGALTNPIGLLTIDEYMMAGAGPYRKATSDFYGYTSSSGAFYLYDNSNHYWSMTPGWYAWGCAAAGYVGWVGGVVSELNVSSNLNVLPAVSLKSDAITGGTGTSSDPFTVG